MASESKAERRKLGRIESQLDPIDWILLEEVQRNARISFAELGRKAGVSAPAAAERLRRLEDARLITGYTAQVNPAALGLAMTVLIEAQVRRADYPRFHKAVEKLDWVLECHHISGKSAFLVKAAVPDVEGLERLIGHLSQFGETQTSLVLSTLLSRRVFVRE